MDESLENPFDPFGIPDQERFIGRVEQLAIIRSRLLPSPGNLSIIGERRIGKSSLAWRSVMDRRDDFLARRVIPIWLSLSLYSTPEEFFYALVEECIQELDLLGWAAPEHHRLGQKVKIEEQIRGLYPAVMRFFTKIRQAQIQVLFVIDEFDYARGLFANEIHWFIKLRELSSKPTCRVCFLTVSRHSVYDIEPTVPDMSSFAGTFRPLNLGMFEDLDLDGLEAVDGSEGVVGYFSRFSNASIYITPVDRARILDYSGRHPYILARLGYEIVDMCYGDTANIDIDRAALAITPDVLKLYRQMIECLREDNLLASLLQVLAGRSSSVPPETIQRLIQSGFIQPTTQGTYDAFSSHFQQYLDERPPVEQPLKEGDRIADGRYEIKDLISSWYDSNSYVYTAVDHNLNGRKVVVKIPVFFFKRDQLGTDTFEALRQRYKQEVLIVAQISHPHIAKVYEFAQNRYMIQEWVEGQSLRQFIAQQQRENTRLPIQRLLKIGLEVCRVMRELHEQYDDLVHRDIKPEHIFVQEVRDSVQVRIIDFGLAQAGNLLSTAIRAITGEQPILGTKLYMAPEQARVGKVDHRADIFALGVTLYELFTLKLPFPEGAWSPHLYTDGAVPEPFSISEMPPNASAVPEPSSIGRMHPNAPAELEACLARALCLEAGDRYQTWHDFEQHLHQVIDSTVAPR